MSASSPGINARAASRVALVGKLPIFGCPTFCPEAKTKTEASAGMAVMSSVVTPASLCAAF